MLSYLLLLVTFFPNLPYDLLPFDKLPFLQITLWSLTFFDNWPFIKTYLLDKFPFDNWPPWYLTDLTFSRLVLHLLTICCPLILSWSSVSFRWPHLLGSWTFALWMFALLDVCPLGRLPFGTFALWDVYPLGRLPFGTFALRDVCPLKRLSFEI